MSTLDRRSFLRRGVYAGAGLSLAGTGLLSWTVLGPSDGPASAEGAGYGPLVADPAGRLDLPAGFAYRMFSAAGETLDGGAPVPGQHDGMGAFAAPGGGILLVRNHEIGRAEVTAGAVPVAAGPAVYDRNAPAGTTTLLLRPDRTVAAQHVSLSGTVDNCSGGPTPWGTWLTCEETSDVIDGLPHGYVFEVDPHSGGDPEPIRAMGRFPHEAVAFGPDGAAYLTEDGAGPHGCVYRYRPARPGGGAGSLHAGGLLEVMTVAGVTGDLSEVDTAGAVLDGVAWIPVPEPDPVLDGAPTRTQVDAALRVPKCEGTWWSDGRLWFVSSRAKGPGAGGGEASIGRHGGQLWSYDPATDRLRLAARFKPSSDFEGPDNVTASPHGFLVVCTDSGGDREFLAGITPAGEAFPIASHRMGDEEFAGACFSPDGQTLFVNIQDPGVTVAIWGPWAG